VVWRTPGCPLMTREAVVRDTPASFAICSSVKVFSIFPVLFGTAPESHFHCRKRFQDGHGEKRVKSGENSVIMESKKGYPMRILG
jgi:hypothetical protein